MENYLCQQTHTLQECNGVHLITQWIELLKSQVINHWVDFRMLVVRFKSGFYGSNRMESSSFSFIFRNIIYIPIGYHFISGWVCMWSVWYICMYLHTHTHIYIYYMFIFIYIYICVCVCGVYFKKYFQSSTTKSFY